MEAAAVVAWCGTVEEGEARARHRREAVDEHEAQHAAGGEVALHIELVVESLPGVAEFHEEHRAVFQDEVVFDRDLAGAVAGRDPPAAKVTPKPPSRSSLAPRHLRLTDVCFIQSFLACHAS